MIQLNLLPDVKKEFIKAQRTRNTVISFSILATAIAGGLLVLGVLYVYGGQPLVSKLQSDDIRKNATRLQDIPEIDKYLTVQNQLANIEDLHRNKVIYSRIFGYLQQLNPAAPNNIALSNVTIAREGNTIDIEGNARNFEAVNVFQNTLDTAIISYTTEGQESTVDLFKDIVPMQTGLSDVNGTTLATFKFQVTYTEEAFAPTTAGIKLRVPSLVTSDADRNAPKEVFATQPEGTEE